MPALFALILWIIGLFILYVIIKYAVKNGIKEAKEDIMDEFMVELGKTIETYVKRTREE
ncbi:DUF6019 family protein [Dethiothermospora halolimnae]|uniref:DUF6019 family protein n=1 Tax=Dethiothermospora halolimnae TaxID=3114390 RepID=UPI003CCBF7E2